MIKFLVLGVLGALSTSTAVFAQAPLAAPDGAAPVPAVIVKVAKDGTTSFLPTQRGLTAAQAQELATKYADKFQKAPDAVDESSLTQLDRDDQKNAAQQSWGWFGRNRGWGGGYGYGFNFWGSSYYPYGNPWYYGGCSYYTYYAPTYYSYPSYYYYPTYAYVGGYGYYGYRGGWYRGY